MSAKKACETAGYTLSRTGDFASASVTQRVADCAECQGTGLLRTTVSELGRSYEVTAPCPRTQLVRRAQLFNGMQLPGVHVTASFESYKPSRAEQDRAHKFVSEFSMRYPELRGFILSGPVGTGKTHLMAAALKHLTLELGVKCAYVEISLLFAQIRRGFNEGKSGGEIIGPLSQVDVLAIDELGKGRGSAFELETLDELIARRYNAGRTTLFATNYSLRAPEERNRTGYTSTAEAISEASRESRLLCERVGDRIYSRLTEMCEFFEFPSDAPDMRRTKVASRARP